MDLVQRLNFFVKSEGISPSVLADTCGIPRPTVSQLLNGRSKKISDDIISKIHKVYPHLSVLWLMFGEGEMLLSDKSNAPEQSSPIQNIYTDLKSDEFVSYSPTSQDDISQKSEPQNFQDISGLINLAATEDTANADSDSSKQKSVYITPDSHKKITNIVVFYSDNSFQAFLPSQN